MKNIIHSILLLIIINISCKKECQEPYREKSTLNCIHIPPAPSPPGWGYDHISDEKGKLFPYFNPNNGNEFVYLEHNPNTRISNIYTYNLQSKKKTLIHTSKTWYHVLWTTDNWIIFHNTVDGIYKIKCDGTNLTKITNLEFRFTIQDYSNLLFYRKLNATPSNDIYYFSNLENNIYDSLKINIGSTLINWGVNNKIIFTQGEGHYIYDLNTKTYSNYNEYYKVNNSNSRWISDYEFVWSANTSVFKTNINTNTTDTLFTHCNAFTYRSFDYSPSTNKLICTLLTSILEEGVTKQKDYVVLMNTDGTEKEIINLDKVCY